MDMLFLWQLQAFVDALLSIVAGCIIIGVSRECDADAVGGIFLGAGGLGLLISIYPFIKAWLNINHILPSFGNFRVHPTPANPAAEPQIETLRREGEYEPFTKLKVQYNFPKGLYSVT
uniref:Kinocilin n=1 Tax=Mastacembelus armatus TaxID=205130 RepID=A0A3Q3LX15_9TELE